MCVCARRGGGGVSRRDEEEKEVDLHGDREKMRERKEGVEEVVEERRRMRGPRDKFKDRMGPGPRRKIMPLIPQPF